MIIVDTDVLIEIFDKNSRSGEAALNAILENREPFCTTSINQHELLYGIMKYNKHVPEELSAIPILDYTKRDADLSPHLELELEKKGKRIARMDAMIAAVAINNKAKFYTNNKKHFREFKEFGLELL
ncbi:MAG: type II toxin-antitoxin system VapC family toxin [Candidatus Marsarchaeota archaeon]|nr:type II toxin-antitoxin system VapC family toxin [Candidatus Marsarchaeota archaeon]